MVKSGDILHNPLSGETFTILKTSTETNGKLFQMETRVPAKQGTHVPPHLHPAHAMRLTILQGGMKLWTGHPKNEKLYEKGSEIIVPIHTPYNWTIAGDNDLRFITEFEPAGEWETLFESMSAIGRAASEKRLNPVLASMSVLNRHRNHMYFSPLPIGVQKVLFAGIAFIAKWIGYPDHYSYQ